MKIGRVYRESMGNYIREGVEKRSNIFFVSYSKISSTQMDDLRKTLKKVGARLFVSKNSIAKRTLKDLHFERLTDKFIGQMAFVWSDTDSVEVSKALTKFAKGCEGLRFQGGLLQGKVLETNDVKRLSDLPSREVLLTMFLGSVQSPLVGLMGVLNGKTRELVYLLKQLSEQKVK